VPSQEGERIHMDANQSHCETIPGKPLFRARPRKAPQGPFKLTSGAISFH